MPKFKESKYYQDWLIKAKRDLDTAILNHQHGGYTDTTCYFCQQVVEKALETKYPASPSIDYSRKETAEALLLTTEVFNFITKKIKI